jgi:ATP-dependent 26S proteasome regulatory subunit
LLAKILKEEEAISSGKFVECGRQDLVGRYVGWTANIVEEKFKEARGGVLFIDEAYSLVDDSNTYGAEAINTITQLMENYRDEVIVIFAGYPDKMQEFLEQAILKQSSRIINDFVGKKLSKEEMCRLKKEDFQRLQQGSKKQMTRIGFTWREGA